MQAKLPIQRLLPCPSAGTLTPGEQAPGRNLLILFEGITGSRGTRSVELSGFLTDLCGAFSPVDPTHARCVG